MSASGWKYTFRMPRPFIDSESMCSIPLTVVEYARSLIHTIRRSICTADSPE